MHGMIPVLSGRPNVQMPEWAQSIVDANIEMQRAMMQGSSQRRKTASEAMPGPLDVLKSRIHKCCHPDTSHVSDQKHAALQIQRKISELAGKLGVRGEVKIFGSWLNGLNTGSSDLDVVFLTAKLEETAASLLERFANAAPKEFSNMTTVFKANTPLLKFTDSSSNLEVDFCIDNRLGLHNSHLLLAYCQYDERVPQLGRCIKEWARAHELMGTADGYLNSYAYMLLVIHFLQQCSPPVVPNLQILATAPEMVTDEKWGCRDTWDVKFFKDVGSLPKSVNRSHVAELLVGFFWYYGFKFDWSKHAVCMRFSRENTHISKYKLATSTHKEQWYIEDPFDLKHNLAGKCTDHGCKRILDHLRKAYSILVNTGNWQEACPPFEPETFLLKCSVTMQFLHRV
jgi:terminal uridylyltransferase